MLIVTLGGEGALVLDERGETMVDGTDGREAGRHLRGGR